MAISRGITMAGAEAGYIATLALSWHLTGSASQASLVLLASVAGRTGFAPVAGWIGDHVDRRKVVVSADLVAAAAYGSLFFATSIWHVLVAILIGTCASMTGGAALDASIPSLASDELDLTAANSTVGVGRTTGHMVGPALGGVLIASFGAPAAFALDGATSLVAAGVFLFVRGDVGGSGAAGSGAATADEAIGETRRGSLLAGLTNVAEDALLRRYVAARMALCVAFAFVTAAELPLAVEHGYDETGLALIITAWCAGSLVGSWIARYARTDAGGAATLTGSAVAVSVVFVASGLSPWFSGVVTLMALGGMSLSLSDVVTTTLIQSSSDDRVRARVMAAIQGLDSAVFGTHLALAGMLVDATSAGTVYVVSGVWCIIAAGGFSSLRAVQRQRELDHALGVLVPRHALESELAEGA